MFTQKSFNRIGVILMALVILALWPAIKATADNYSNSPAKGNSMSGQMKTSSEKNESMSSMNYMTHKGKLDGKTFSGKMSDPSDPAKEYDETISFHNGEFHSSACDAYGFGEAPYTIKKEKGTTSFECTTNSSKDGHMSQLKWMGTIRGNVLNATAKMITDGKPTGTSTITAQIATKTLSKTK